ncbi:MAG: hypothetical protein KGZ86_08145 [Candidatus Latescibacteria bacterium]|nr:hypothetical protein [Candidatus Latescibacterota bacterium]
MKILLILLVFIGVQFANSFDFSKWAVKIETKDLPSGTTYTHTQIESIARVVIKNIDYDANQTVEDFLKVNGKIARQFERLMLKSKASDIRFLSDGSTIYDYEVPITGAILQLLTPEQEVPTLLTQLACPTCKRAWLENTPVPEGISLIPLESELTPQYTGILIDARDIILKPAMFPRIYNEENKQAYSVNFANLEYLQVSGLITYVTALTDAFNNNLVGINPLRITALRSVGERKTDIVISNASSKMMHSSQDNLKLLEHCKVVILISE